MVSAGLIKVAPLVSDRYTLSEVEEAFHRARSGDAIKVMIRVLGDPSRSAC